MRRLPRNCRLLDAYSPFPVEDVAATSRPAAKPHAPDHVLRRTVRRRRRLWRRILHRGDRLPYNSGGRPFNSWPAFLLVPFAVGILGATIAGFIAFLAETGLPRLHHPLFALERFERASQDGFLLALARPDDERQAREAIEWLRRSGAVSVAEVDT